MSNPIELTLTLLVIGAFMAGMLTGYALWSGK